MRFRIPVLVAFSICAICPAPALAQARKPAPAATTMTVLVTDKSGNPLPGVRVEATGPVHREGTTDDAGTLLFKSVTAGTYLLHIEHDGYVTLERETIVQRGRPAKLSISLNAAPAPPEPAPAEEPVTEAAPPPPAGPPADVVTMSLPDFIERNYIGRNPALTLQIGCTPESSTTLVQLREPLADHDHPDADELIYVIAGDGTHRIGGREQTLSAGSFAIVPRGATHSIARRGSNPIIVLSIMSGKTCEGD